MGLMDHLHDAAYLDTSMGMCPLGTPESVGALSLDGVKSFYAGGLSGSRVIVSGAGAVHQVSAVYFIPFGTRSGFILNGLRRGAGIFTSD